MVFEPLKIQDKINKFRTTQYRKIYKFKEYVPKDRHYTNLHSIHGLPANKSKRLRVPEFGKTKDNELVKIQKAYAFERLRLQKKLKREPKSQEEGSRFLLYKYSE